MKKQKKIVFAFRKWNLRLDQNFSRKNQKKIFWIMMVPSYDNLGDQAITEHTIKFLKKNFPEYGIREVSELTKDWQYRYLKNKMKSNDIIILPGGGNFGDIWPVTEEIRQKIVTIFMGKKIISFPQSYSFSDEKSDILRDANSIYTRAVDFFSFRDSISYKKFEEHFLNKSILTPDIVMDSFSQYIDSNIDKKFDILTILRDDQERAANSNRIKSIIKIASQRWNISNTDTKPLNTSFVNRRNRSFLLDEKSKQIKQAKLVITDRLHGLILARAQGIPVILFNNADGKIVNLYNTWLKDDEGILIGDQFDTSQIYDWAKRNMGKTIAPINMEANFTDLIRNIEKVFHD